MPLNGHRNELAPALATLASGKNGKTAFIARDGMARQSSVIPGLENGVWVEIMEGLLEETDGVVVRKSGFTDGQAVRASPYNLPTGKSASQKL
jgi:hypothetical protein